jgi:hypothetical protein
MPVALLLLAAALGSRRKRAAGPTVGRSGPKIALETATGDVTVVDSARPSR